MVYISLNSPILPPVTTCCRYLSVLQPKDLLDVLDLCIPGDLCSPSIPHV